MKVTVIGTGYVGLVSGACLADAGHDVMCIDSDKNKIDQLCAGYVPIYEPGLEALLKSNLEAQQQVMKVVVPFYKVWAEMRKYTQGDGYLDKLCMELVGLGSSRNRPPTRDVREQFRDMTLKMLQDTGVPNLIS